jgi:hypothetical protein
MNGIFAIRQGDWKLIAGPNSGGFGLNKIKEYEALPQVQLSNFASDPAETNNLYLQFPDKVKELNSLLEITKTQVGKDEQY